MPGMNSGTCSRPFSHPLLDARWAGSAFLTIACVAAAYASSVRPSSLLALVRTVGIGDGAYPMNTLVRLLEDWTTYQDYLWFLACLAWGAIAAAEIRWKREAGSASNAHPARWWLLSLAISGMASGLLELALLAQNIRTPYLKFDFAMGAAQAFGIGTLVWIALDRVQTPWRRWTLSIIPVVSLAMLRTLWPASSGSVLALICATAAWRVVRSIQCGDIFPELEGGERRMAAAAVACLALSGAISTHGPIAYLANEPRITTDLSHFALPAVLLLGAAGALLALPIWRERLRRFSRVADASGIVIRREFTRSVALLIVWLLVGLGLAVWNGRIARRAFEDGLLHRTSTATALLTPDITEAAFGSDLRVARLDTLQSIATITNAQSEALRHWRAVIQNLRAANSDVPAIYVEVIRDGWLFIPVTTIDRERPEECPATPIADQGAFKQSQPFVEGPTRSYLGGDAFFARAPLFGLQSNKEPLAWLVFGVSATKWTAAFTQARMQAMALAGLGFVLWVVMLAYRLRREERLAADRRATAAVESERIKTAFLAKVSHELRTPIQSVLGYGELLTDTRLDEQPRRWLGALRSHGEIMLRLVNDLLDISALDAGAFRLRPMTADFCALLAECAAALRVRAETKGLSLDLVIADGVPTWVEIDPVRMRQILLNLLGNAVKFTTRGGVNLTARCVNSVEGVATVEVVVSDTGPGIPASKRSQLFQPFVQLNETGEGTGLGLSLVAGLCAAMGGTVQCDQPSSGATFRVRLPLPLRAPITPVAIASREALSYRGQRIVVADDNALVRDFLVEALRIRGAEVIAVADGKAAVAACAEKSPYAVILDLSMPLMDGFAAATTIRAQPRGKAIRMVGLSAHAQPEDETRARAAGMDTFLSKPISLNQLDVALCGHNIPVAEPNPSEDESWARIREKLRTQFELETPLLIDELRSAVRNQEWETVRARAHYLKGSADIIGAQDLQTACQEILKLDLAVASHRAVRLFENIETAANRALSESSSGISAP